MSIEDDRREMAGVSLPAGDRRLFLRAAAGLIATGVASSGAAAQTGLPTLPPIPHEWNAAPTLPLWPMGTPGQGYSRQALPDGWPDGFVRNIDTPALRVFRPIRPNGRALLVIPGGAYLFVSILNEGVDVARAMTALGYTVFVLTYRLPAEGWADRADVPLQDAQRAMRLIRANAARYGFDAAQVAAVGFSAGGHLGASLAVGHAENLYPARDASDRLDARPFAMGLIYPVISASPPVTHRDSMLNLLGPKPSSALVTRRSPADHVTQDTPPMFLAHANDDPAVPPDNSAIMQRAMTDARRPVEAHYFESGGHGFGLGPSGSGVAAWSTLFARWLDNHAAR